MLGGEMQVDEGVFQPGMSEKDLNSTQVGAGFEKMGSTTMAQAVRGKAFGDAGSLGSLPTGEPDRVGADGDVGANSFHGARKQKGGGPHPAPVDAQSLQQLGAQRNLAVAAALALVNADHHALTVDVLYLQPTEFGPACGGGIQGHEQRPVIEIAGRVDQSGYFLRAEHGGQSLAGFGKWNVLRQKMSAQSLYEQEAQRGHILTDCGRSQLLGLEQISLILPNLLGPEFVRWLVKILRKIADDANVGFCGTMGIVATLSL